MKTKYKNLTDLLENCKDAKQIFCGLPDYVQSSIRERGNNVCSVESLDTYARNLLAGDD